MRIDAHQHYWRVDRGDYDWMSAPSVAPIRRDFLPADLEPCLARHRIERSVLVQAAPTSAETDFLLELADAHPSIAAVVGWIEPDADDFAGELSRRVLHPRFVGIRPMLQDIPDERYVCRPRVVEHLRELARSGRRLDLLVLPKHLPHAIEALAKVPELFAVVDHCAKPDLRAGSLDAWRRDLQRIAEFPRVYCKLSGLVTEAPAPFGAEHLAPAIEHVLACFGPDRLLFGSDWPVCTLAASYDRVVEVLTEVLGARLSGDFERKLFGENAARFYGL